jgi:hypothetical protein
MAYWYSRFLFERALAAMYLVGFAVAVNQFVPLLGERGLLPVSRFTQLIPFRASPSLFYLSPTDTAFRVCAWLGLGLAVLMLTGWPQQRGAAVSAVVWALMWVLYLSFVNVGQTFYGFGWETLLLESGFLAIFLGGWSTTPSVWLVWMYRWLLFRVMFGAGLIKIRGDSCWRDLTCLNYYFETQPIPNSLSWHFHWLPETVHKAGVAINHVVELIVPFAYFAPQPIAGIGPRHDRVPGCADRQRQPVMAELGDGSAVHPGARRSVPLVAADFSTGAARARPRSTWRDLPARRRRRSPERRANAEHAVGLAGDEHVVRAASSREHVRCVRHHHAHPV